MGSPIPPFLKINISPVSIDFFRKESGLLTVPVSFRQRSRLPFQTVRLGPQPQDHPASINYFTRLKIA